MGVRVKRALLLEFPGMMASCKDQGVRCGRKDVSLFHFLALPLKKDYEMTRVSHATSFFCLDPAKYQPGAVEG